MWKFGIFRQNYNVVLKDIPHNLNKIYYLKHFLYLAILDLNVQPI